MGKSVASAVSSSGGTCGSILAFGAAWLDAQDAVMQAVAGVG
jgi:hypothetical protein